MCLVRPWTLYKSRTGTPRLLRHRLARSAWALRERIEKSFDIEMGRFHEKPVGRIDVQLSGGVQERKLGR